MQAMAEAIKCAAMYSDKSLIGKLCKLMVSRDNRDFVNLEVDLRRVSDSMTVQDLSDWVRGE